MSAINYSEKIPNNVNLSEDRTLQRALEQWQPNYLQWWGDMGPEGSTDAGSVSPCVTMMRRRLARCSPGTSCQAGSPRWSPKWILRSFSAGL